MTFDIGWVPDGGGEIVVDLDDFNDDDSIDDIESKIDRWVFEDCRDSGYGYRIKGLGSVSEEIYEALQERKKEREAEEGENLVENSESDPIW